ncbi:spore coat putative kinase YutH [Halalkalibacter oceani]|uniref:Spore coat protein YutH n=1 Tax=Halalkalibacter oceani TaxID=1653776 RepID=A0A9X2DNB5_9BACI|nr:spore coat protein YutH [Halalkalibacter oceani]MCM3714054.1 spore coat protein YutH [Halalkalibacter oceani]MCM3760464.1 spore coat protein YutH [Halalkalibacter oceani]
MFERNVYDVYGLYCEERFHVGMYDAFEAGGQSYILLPKEESMLREEEMIAFTDYMKSIGDTTILTPLPTLRGQRAGLIDGQLVYLCALPPLLEESQMRVRSEADQGAHLAAIHYYGRQMPYEARQYEFFGQWHKLWETRLDQLEGWYQQLLYQGPQSYVDEAFLFSFPYYMGLTENAIQFVVDAMLDDPSKEQERPTICHRRYTDHTWLVLSEHGAIVKRPTEFVYDHPCRDLAEWIRDQRRDQRSFSWNQIESFLTTYEQYETLSSYSWRLLYARLVFPLHYFEAVEDYYSSQIREEQISAGQHLFQLLDTEGENEKFLKEFAAFILPAKAGGQLPVIEWLAQ